jgi:hypothetical protein
MGRPFSGPGPDHLELALREILAGSTRHGGALLAPFGVRFVVAERAAVPAAARDAFDAQIDVNVVPAAGFLIYRNAVALPPAAGLETEPLDRRILGAGDPSTIAMWRSVPAIALRRVRGGWDGPPVVGTVLLSSEYDPGWELEGTSRRPEVAFGWATSFLAEGERIRVRHGGSLPARIQAALLAIIWLLALWATRRPVAR